MSRCLVVLVSFWVLPFYCLAQSPDDAPPKGISISPHLLSKIHRKLSVFNEKLLQTSQHYLGVMAEQEARLQQAASRLGTSSGNPIVWQPGTQYGAWMNKIKMDSGARTQAFSGVYPAYLDSLQGSMKFLQQHPELVKGQSSGVSPQTQEELRSINHSLQILLTRMQDADQIKGYLAQRKQRVAQYLSEEKLTSGAISRPFRKMNQQVYYYSQELRQYKELWSNPDQLTQKALSLLNRLPAFQPFMKDNSLLGNLFGLPSGYHSPQAISGLQTKTQVAALVQAQIGSSGGGASAGAGGSEASVGSSGGASPGQTALQSNLENAESQLNSYKSKLSSLGSGNGDMDMPNFKPNDQKTKTFWHRLEYGADFQTTHTDYYFPMITDFGVSMGYKLGHDNIVGIGASYKLGWGNGIQHIAFSNQGLGLRTFLQIHIKSSFSATGGFECNYTTPFASFKDLKLIQRWTNSGLIGLTKTVSLKNRVFKKTSVSLLWDFLSYQQVPQTQPFLFRIGYTF